jgi:ribosome-binding factor A
MPPSGSNRSDRVKKAMIRELSEILMSELQEPRLENKVISVTDVELSADFGHAKVFISIFADEEERHFLMSVLLSQVGKLRKALGPRLRLRYTPELHLHLDDSLERGSQMNALLEKIAREEF